jgi:Domain of unknown function (DUF1707)
MSPQPEPRIGDVEREAAVHALGEHYAAGRITKEEFDERSDVAMRARTNADLRPLFADLPRPSGPGTSEHQPGKVTPRRIRPGLWVLVPLVLLAVPLVTVLVLAAVITKAWWIFFAVWLVFMCRPRGARRTRSIGPRGRPGASPAGCWRW